MTGFEPLFVVVGATSLAVIATIGEDTFKRILYGPEPRTYHRGDPRLSNCCAEKVLGEYHWGTIDDPPVGICRGCRDHAVFYTEEEFEENDFEENGYNYGQYIKQTGEQICHTESY